MAMLEAFVHDPLINWRLLNTTTDAVDAGNTPTADSSKTVSPKGFDLLFVYIHWSMATSPVGLSIWVVILTFTATGL